MVQGASKREVLYLKYRPQILSEVFGQNHIKRTLSSALLKNRISHAYLFTGPRGTGKTTIARILAKAVNCSSPQKGEPDNKCQSCQEITAGRSLDVVEIDAASNRGIDEIRELRDKVKFSPSKSKYKVFIIDEVHMLTREAFNALLKTLEEPPSHALFVLATTEIHKVPETIISRCQRFDFSRIKMADLIEYLKKVSRKEKLKVEQGALELIAANSGGSLRDAVNLLDQASSFGGEINISSLQTILGLTDIEAVYQLTDLLIDKNVSDSIELVNDLLEKGYDISSFLKKIIEHLRHILILKVSGRTELLEVTAEQLAKIQSQVSNLKTGQLLGMIKAFLKAQEKTSFANLPQLPLEMAVLEINEMVCKTESIEVNNKITKSKLVSNDESLKSTDVKKEKEKSNKLNTNKLKNFKSLIRNWNNVLEETKILNHSVNAFLKACRPSSLEGDTIYLDFFYVFHKEKISEPKNRDMVERAIKKVTGKSYKIKCQFNPKTQKKEKEKEDETLKAALEVFGGEIIE